MMLTNKDDHHLKKNKNKTGPTGRMVCSCKSAQAPGVMVELLRDVIHHVILWCFMSHGLAQLARHQRLCHGLLAMLPEEQCHLLPLHQHSPHHQLMEGEWEVVDFRVIQIDVHLLLPFSCGLLPPSSDWHVILSQQRHLDNVRCIFTRDTKTQIWLFVDQLNTCL